MLDHLLDNTALDAVDLALSALRFDLEVDVGPRDMCTQLGAVERRKVAVRSIEHTWRLDQRFTLAQES